MTYTCPKCKQIMICITTASMPSYTSYWCPACGYSSKEIKGELRSMELPKEYQNGGDT